MTTEYKYNLSIYQAVAAIAREVFDKYVTIEAGQYDAAYMATQYKGASTRYYFADELDKKELSTVSVGSFTCSFRKSTVFIILYRLQKSLAIKVADKVTFTREAEEDDVKASFTLPKTAKEVANIAKVASKDHIFRSVFHGVYVDIKKHRIVASNGKVLTAQKITEVTSDGSGDGYLIPWDFVRKHAGKPVTISGDYAKSESDAVRLMDERFPNYETVIPCCKESDALDVSGGVFKAIKKAAKELSKAADDYERRVILSGDKGADVITVKTNNYKKEEFTREIKLNGPVQYTFAVAVDIDLLNTIADAEIIYMSDKYLPLVLVSAGRLSLLMPKTYRCIINEADATEKADVWQKADMSAPVQNAENEQKAETIINNEEYNNNTRTHTRPQEAAQGVKTPKTYATPYARRKRVRTHANSTWRIYAKRHICTFAHIRRKRVGERRRTRYFGTIQEQHGGGSLANAPPSAKPHPEIIILPLII